MQVNTMDDSVQVIELSSDGEIQDAEEENCKLQAATNINEDFAKSCALQEKEEDAEEDLYPIFKRRGKSTERQSRKLSFSGSMSSATMGTLPLAARARGAMIGLTPGNKYMDQCPVSTPLKTDRGSKGGVQQSRAVAGQLWVDKYAPVLESELAVHKKKVADVRSWLQAQLQGSPNEQGPSRVLLLTGPAGAGKTAVVQVLAQELNLDMCEWAPPVPTLWEEHIHQGSAGIPYISKVNEFQDFLEASARFPALALGPARIKADQRERRDTSTIFSQLEHQMVGSCEDIDQEERSPLGNDHPRSQKAITVGQTGHSSQERKQQDPTCQQRKLLLIEDLPLAGDTERKRQLAGALHNLATTARFPTIVIVTDTADQRERGDRRRDGTLEYQRVLEEAGASKIAFNPIAPSLIKRAVSKIADAEGCKVPVEIISALPEGSSGDIRHAISRLQFYCLGNRLQPSSKPTWDPGGGRNRSKKAASRKRKLSESEGLDNSGTGFAAGASIKVNNLYSDVSRDNILSLFHALGKILYNKRMIDKPSDGSTISWQLLEHLRRQPQDMEEPEAILAHAQTDTATLSAFLHENVLDFIAEDGIEDVAQAEAYLSDADCLQSGRGGFRSSGSGADSSAAADHTEPDPGRIAAAAAGSVLARGLLFSNCHPVPRRFHAFRSPYLWQMERARRLQLAEMSPVACMARGLCLAGGILDYGLVTMDLEPFRQRLDSLGYTISAHLPAYSNMHFSKEVQCHEEILKEQEELDVLNADEKSKNSLPVEAGSLDIFHNLPLPRVESGAHEAMEEEIEEW